jgi:hypothetical protein
MPVWGDGIGWRSAIGYGEDSGWRIAHPSPLGIATSAVVVRRNWQRPIL